MEHEITREIGIDAGHRVTFHGSKCRNLHGHRYTIQATCIGPLVEAGEEQGMVLDFGFLKEEMMQQIDALCDHALILWHDDNLVRELRFAGNPEEDRDEYHCASVTGLGGRMYLVPFMPTAENLACHWFKRLEPRVIERSAGRARLANIRVYETPNCWSDYPPHRARAA